MSIRMSSSQYSMMLLLLEKKSWTIEYAGTLKQTTYGSLLAPGRGYIYWNELHQKFHVTMTGERAVQAFKEAEIWRRVASSNLTRYFYGADVAAKSRPRSRNRRFDRGKMDARA